jgi:hypothetical protein
LREFPTLDDLGDLVSQFRLRKRFLRLGRNQIGEELPLPITGLSVPAINSNVCQIRHDSRGGITGVQAVI